MNRCRFLVPAPVQLRWTKSLVGVHNDARLFHFLLSAMRAFAVHRIPRNERVLTSALRAFEKWEVLVQVFHWHLHHVLAFLATKLHNHAAE